MDRFFSSWYVAAVVIGAAMGIGLSFSEVWWAGLLGVAFFFMMLQRADTFRQAIGFGYLVGVVSAGISLVWFFSVYPLEWLGLELSWTQVFLIAAYWLPAALTLGTGTLVFAVVYFYSSRFLTKEASPNLLGWFLLPPLWVACEVLGSYVFSLYTYAPEIPLSANFSFGRVGYLLAEHNVLLQAASLGGVYVLSALVVIVSLLLVQLYKADVRYAIVFLFVLVVSAYVPMPSKDDLPSVVAAGTVPELGSRLQVETMYANRDMMYEVLVASLESGASYIVLPEDSRLTEYFNGPRSMLAYLQREAKNDVVVIDSVRVDLPEGTFLRAFVYDTANDRHYYFDKQYLVPQGEYMPLVYQPLVEKMLPPEEVERFTSWFSYQPGIAQSNVLLSEDIPGVLFCFESVAPGGIRSALGGRKNVPFVSHIVSHSWFGGEVEILWNQLDAMLKVQAVWNQVPVVVSGAYVTPRTYTSTGEIIDMKKTASGERWGVFELNF